MNNNTMYTDFLIMFYGDDYFKITSLVESLLLSFYQNNNNIDTCWYINENLTM